uniref:DNA-directed RNA polymerase II subunit RPB1-like n=1 Tax=Caenorhabditis tropicalis TaxID=1561998 RepID=A0A1I7UVT3_9PELO
MKSGPYTSATAVTSTSTSQSNHWMPTSTTTYCEPPTKYQKMSSSTSAPISYSSGSSSSSLKMKTTKTSRKRQSPKHTPLPPLPAISTFFDSGSSSHSSSTNSSYGSYCQFSPEGSYTVYHYPLNLYPFTGEPTTTVSTSTSAMPSPAPMLSTPPMSAYEHKPVYEPLFIQTADYPYNYSAPDPTGGYPSSATINASQLLLRPVPNGHN